jgi:hypothetical protein
VRRPGGDDRQLGQEAGEVSAPRIQDLLDDISPEHGDLVVAESTGWDRMQNTAQTVLLNGRVESQRYDAMLQAEAGLLPAAPSVPPS